jgi:hypothetical protein
VCTHLNVSQPISQCYANAVCDDAGGLLSHSEFGEALVFVGLVLGCTVFIHINNNFIISWEIMVLDCLC